MIQIIARVMKIPATDVSSLTPLSFIMKAISEEP
jgi:hypothetical protein